MRTRLAACQTCYLTSDFPTWTQSRQIRLVWMDSSSSMCHSPCIALPLHVPCLRWALADGIPWAQCCMRSSWPRAPWQQSAQMDPQKLPAMAGQGLPLVLDESPHRWHWLLETLPFHLKRTQTIPKCLNTHWVSSYPSWHHSAFCLSGNLHSHLFRVWVCPSSQRSFDVDLTSLLSQPGSVSLLLFHNARGVESISIWEAQRRTAVCQHKDPSWDRDWQTSHCCVLY